MRLKKAFRISLDLAMPCLFLFLLSYPLTRGLWRHGIAGFLLLTLFLTHHLLNLNWYGALSGGKWKGRRLFAACIDVLLLAAALIMFATCLFLTGEVFPIVPFAMTWWAKPLHGCAAAWLFAISAVHLGIHWPGLWNFGLYIVGRWWPPAAWLIFFSGMVCAVQSGMVYSLFMLYSDNGRPESIEGFILEYLGIMAAFYLLPGLAGWARRSRP